jgi:capsular polysaccharide biosynthesis protein/chaperonin cofactor prefoldin
VRSIVTRSVGPWLAILTLTAAGTAAAVGYGLTAPKEYRATAQLLVSPVSVTDPTYSGLDVLRDSGGKQTAAASAAALLRSPQVADEVRADLGLARSRDSLLKALDAHVVDSSDVVAVTMQDTSAAGAAQLANAFADSLVKQRTASFQSQLTTTIRRDQTLLSAIPAAKRTAPAAVELERRLAVLQGFQGQPDPTLRHAGQASAPAAASWPKLPRLAAIGALAGLAAGVVAALLLLLARLGRRSSAREGAPYDRAVSDRLVERLEQRVTERIAALEEERHQLAVREAALAVRERDVTAKLDELRVAIEAVPGSRGVAGLSAPASEATEALDARAAALDARVTELTQREIELARRAAELAKQEKAGSTETDERLAAREVSLAAREDEAAAKLDELRTALAAVPDSSGADPDAAAAELDGRSAVLDARVAELTQREIGLARRAAEVAKREQAVGAREEERELAAAEAPDTGAAEELDDRAEALEARVAELTQREIGLARRAAELAKREQDAKAAAADLARRAAELAKREHDAKAAAADLARRATELDAKLEEAERAVREALERKPEPLPEPVVPAALVDAQEASPGPALGADGEEARGAWNLLVLERLVNDRGGDFPGKRDEWISYLYFLREYAEPDGTMPSSFDRLIQDTFSELVA